jgi:hypothetical protein
MSEDEWLAAPPPSDVVDSNDSAAAVTASASRRTLAMRAGLVVAGAVVGGIVVASVHHDSSATAAPTSFGAPPGQLPGPPQGGFGGLAGEQRLSGTLVSVGSSSVTVRTPNGQATYAVMSASEIVRKAGS